MILSRAGYWECSSSMMVYAYFINLVLLEVELPNLLFAKKGKVDREIQAHQDDISISVAGVSDHCKLSEQSE